MQDINIILKDLKGKFGAEVTYCKTAKFYLFEQRAVHKYKDQSFYISYRGIGFWDYSKVPESEYHNIRLMIVHIDLIYTPLYKALRGEL